jgi:hypothetical protein
VDLHVHTSAPAGAEESSLLAVVLMFLAPSPHPGRKQCWGLFHGFRGRRLCRRAATPVATLRRPIRGVSQVIRLFTALDKIPQQLRAEKSAARGEVRAPLRVLRVAVNQICVLQQSP